MYTNMRVYVCVVVLSKLNLKGACSSFKDVNDDAIDVGDFGVEAGVPVLEPADVEPMPESDLTLEVVFFDLDCINASRYTYKIHAV